MKVFSLCLLGVAASSMAAHASLLIYEGFNGYGAGTLSGISPNANTIGLNQTVNYAGGDGGTPSGPGPAQFAVTGGLSFGGTSQLQTSGGAVLTNTTTANAVLSGRSTASSPVGTLYISYLVNFSGTKGTSSGDGLEVRIAGDDATTNARFRVFADSRNGSTAPGTDYAATATASITNASADSITLATGTTYLMVGVFTNTGVDLSTAAGVASVYAFTSAQFDFMMNQSDPTGYLADLAADSARIGSGADQVSAFATETMTTTTNTTASVIGSGTRLQIVSVKDTATVDEIRVGTGLLDVVPLIPEPGSVMLAVFGAGSLALRRRRSVA